jgi:retron-type reverse transcriptase
MAAGNPRRSGATAGAPRVVIDVDLARSFDTIRHSVLLEKMARRAPKTLT